MLNVEALRDTMRAMPLPRLQAYLRQHQDDPYTVALGLSIAKDKQQAMLAQQGAGGQQPMPKVVDQAIAQVAPHATPMPEDVGIGQLPAQNLAKMAAGGIVAFDEGGEVPGYSGEDESLVRNPFAFLNPGDIMSGIGRIFREGISPTAAQQRREAAQNADLANAMATPAPRSPSAAELDAIVGTGPTGPAAPNAPTGPAAPNAPTGPRAPVGPAAPTAGIPALISTPEAMQKAIANAQSDVKPEVPESISKGIAGIQSSEQAAADEYVKSIRDEQAARQPAMKDFEQRLLQRETRLSQRERDLGPMAMLQAGMAIMGGASPFAAVNIGAGAQVGIDRYTKGAEKLEEARDKMDEAYAKIEEIRRNESRMDSKELREALLKAKQPAIEAAKTTFNALHEDWKLKRQDAVKGVELLMQNQRELFSQAEQTKRTAMTVEGQKAIAGMLPGEARTAIFLGEGKTEQEKYISGVKKIQEATADKTGMAAVKLLAETNAKNAQMGLPPVTMAELLASAQEYGRLMYPKTTTTVPGNAPVLKQPGS